MTDDRGAIPIALIEDLYHASRSLVAILKEGERPSEKDVEGVEDALAGIEEITGWDEQFRLIMDEQLKALLRDSGSQPKAENG